jgi:large subunit ribosomal protein L10
MRQEKSLLLQEIKDKIGTSKAILFASYKQMSPNLAANFRTEVAKTGGTFEVVKKRMLIKAAEQSGFTIDRGDLEGHIGVIFAETDPVQTTKYVFNFRKENEEIFAVVGGRFEGAPCTKKDLELISNLPSQDEMRAQLLGLFEAPMSQTLAVMDAALCSVLHCLENKAALESGEASSQE